MKSLKILAVCVALSGLGACAQAARVDAMTVEAIVQVPPNAPLAQGISIESVVGGTKTNPLWTSQVGNPEFQNALNASLRANGLLADNAGKYSLQAALVALKQPLIGFDMTVTSRVNYVVTETATKRIVFQKEISAEYTATVGDAVIAVKRLQLANEGAIKKNISIFITDMVAAVGNQPIAGNIVLGAPNG